MDKGTINRVIKFLRNELQTNGLNVKGIALFGSQLKRDFNEDSDLDLIIISDVFERKNIFERSSFTMNAEIKTIKKFQIPIDILKMTSKEYENAIVNKRFQAQLT